MNQFVSWVIGIGVSADLSSGNPSSLAYFCFIKPTVRGFPKKQHTEVLSKNWRFKFSSTGLGMSLGSFRESCGKIIGSKTGPLQFLGSGAIWANYSDLLTRYCSGLVKGCKGMFFLKRCPDHSGLGIIGNLPIIPKYSQEFTKRTGLKKSRENPMVILGCFWRTRNSQQIAKAAPAWYVGFSLSGTLSSTLGCPNRQQKMA